MNTQVVITMQMVGSYTGEWDRLQLVKNILRQLEELGWTKDPEFCGLQVSAQAQRPVGHWTGMVQVQAGR